MLNALQQKIQTDFPPLTDVTFELRTVHDSMKEYLSPAFYLTPPMDTGTPNVIYINPAANYQGLELFTTLAHEGFPGHLYQTVTFQRQKSSNPMPTSTPPIIFRILLPQSLPGSPG